MTNEEREMMLNKMFPKPQKKPRKAKLKRTYDVRVALNKSGKKGNVVRFGLINNAAAVLGVSQYIEVSDIEITKNRIYFRTHDEQTHRNIYKLSKNSSDNGNGYYFSITPTMKGEKMYRANWVSKTYPLYHDPALDLYFIENAKEG
jgi:hypothetical protein